MFDQCFYTRGHFLKHCQKLLSIPGIKKYCDRDFNAEWPAEIKTVLIPLIQSIEDAKNRSKGFTILLSYSQASHKPMKIQEVKAFYHLCYFFWEETIRNKILKNSLDANSNANHLSEILKTQLSFFKDDCLPTISKLLQVFKDFYKLTGSIDSVLIKLKNIDSVLIELEIIKGINDLDKNVEAKFFKELTSIFFRIKKIPSLMNFLSDDYKKDIFGDIQKIEDRKEKLPIYEYSKKKIFGLLSLGLLLVLFIVCQRMKAH